MSQRIACLIKLCFSHLSFSSLGKLSRAGRCWRETCGHGGAGSAPGHSAPSTSTQHLALTPQTLYKVQGEPEHPLSHANSRASSCPYSATCLAGNALAQGLAESNIRATRTASSHFPKTSGQ